ncbi:SAM-dependent methyltransferase [Sphingobacterium psychroaquaticum]|uniref:16S rRNA (Cytidine1402-2'-O)-methyltransferase n=1 Tax=Sphingobacterium psychroaquaticum TaxID=561061 RepID=A0A1X7KBQ9_9SPHI|nr:SAM-dependent methyltransferase [Sphingobacterium psychroaquaticum]SMG38583.1 16S rRNA (cytidine1402-2'-O)-methyltransferase [Sphingobacterium psychroaquaticum]
MSSGVLYLIPVPLAERAEKSSYTLIHADLINSIDTYIVENEKVARRFLKEAGLKTPQQQLTIHDYGKHVREKVDYAVFFASIQEGKDLGLMSDAGCPGVADPGAEIVAEAHRRGIRVVPLVGPSSILLALMASGFNGQKFAFQGYLPIDKGERGRKIKELELQSFKERQTQIFIETPFRNQALYDELLRTCKDQTKLCVACNITGEDEFILTFPISQWKKRKVDLHKKPTIFLIYSN